MLETLQLRIASFNVENLSEETSTQATLAERCAILRPQLERLNADILCLQEVDGWRPTPSAPRSLKALDELLAATSYRDFRRASTFKPDTRKPRDKHNLVVLSRWPIGKVAQYANDIVPAPHYRPVTSDPPQPEGPVAWDRPILHVEIALPMGAVLHVINMHLKAPLAAYMPGQKLGPFTWKSVSGWAEGYYLAAIKRAGQALEARMLVDRIFDENANAYVAVCGDFNAEERETPFRILLGDTEDTGNGLLLGRELVALESTLPDFRRFTVIHAGRRQMLDHILVSRSLLAYHQGMEVHNEGLGDEIVGYAMVEKTPESYHAPIVARFDLPTGMSSPNNVIASPAGPADSALGDLTD